MFFISEFILLFIGGFLFAKQKLVGLIQGKMELCSFIPSSKQDSLLKSSLVGRQCGVSRSNQCTKWTCTKNLEYRVTPGVYRKWGIWYILYIFDLCPCQMDHPVLKNDSKNPMLRMMLRGVLVMLVSPLTPFKTTRLFGEKRRLKPPRAQRLARIPLERLGCFDQSP